MGDTFMLKKMVHKTGLEVKHLVKKIIRKFILKQLFDKHRILLKIKWYLWTSEMNLLVYFLLNN